MGVLERVDHTGRGIKVLTGGGAEHSPACLPNGKVWFFSAGEAKPQIMRCDDLGCRRLLERAAWGLSVSPDGTRLAFMTLEKQGPIVEWINVEGGEIHPVAETETGCAAGWASPQTLWVSRRRDGKIVWTEVDADSGVETGRTVPGIRDCSTGESDPASPVNPDLPVIVSRRSQLRLVGNEHLRR